LAATWASINIASAPDATAITTVSVQLNMATEINRKTKPGDSVSVSPVSFNLRVEANSARARHTPKAIAFADCHIHAEVTRIAVPTTMMVQA
jgi:hypothetical protein